MPGLCHSLWQPRGCLFFLRVQYGGRKLMGYSLTEQFLVKRNGLGCGTLDRKVIPDSFLRATRETTVQFAVFVHGHDCFSNRVRFSRRHDVSGAAVLHEFRAAAGVGNDRTAPPIIASMMPRGSPSLRSEGSTET